MSLLVDLISQVRRQLGIVNGGTGNSNGWSGGVIKHCVNRTGSSLALGTVVRLLGTWDDARVTPTTTANDPAVLGVVVGYFRNSDDQLIEAAAATGGSVAVMTHGTCDVLVNAAVTRGRYAYSTTTSGQAASSATLTGGAFGVFEESTTAAGTARVVVGTGPQSSTATQAGDTFVIPFIIDGGGSAITTGIKGDIHLPFACTINEVVLLADQSGSIVLDLWVDSYANYPPTVADTITASAKPTLSTANKSKDSTLTGWTTAIAADRSLRVNVDSITTCTRVLLSLKCTRT